MSADRALADAFPAFPFFAERDEKPRKAPKRKQVKKACACCQKAHAACNNQRPCHRCSQRGLLCMDVPRAKNQETDDRGDAGQPAKKRRRCAAPQEEAIKPLRAEDHHHSPLCARAGEAENFDPAFAFEGLPELACPYQVESADDPILAELFGIFAPPADGASEPAPEDDNQWLAFLNYDQALATGPIVEDVYRTPVPVARTSASSHPSNHSIPPRNAQPMRAQQDLHFDTARSFFDASADSKQQCEDLNLFDFSNPYKLDLFKTSLFDQTLDCLASRC